MLTALNFRPIAGTPALIVASKTVISTGGNVKANLQLATDNKIYVCLAYQTFLAVIDAPNTIGVGCNFINNSVNLLGRTCGLGLPNFMPCLIPIILPESWEYFEIHSEANQVLLDWKVGNPESFREFLVERKTVLDERFQPIGASQAAHSGTTSFESQDQNPQIGYNAYRIRAVGMDGSIAYSETKHVNFEGKSPRVQAFPNPIQTDALQLQVDDWEGLVKLSIVDVSMKALLTTSEMIGPNGRLSLNLKNLPKGIYFVSVLLGDGTQSIHKIVRE
jgi:hypothetical protein